MAKGLKASLEREGYRVDLAFDGEMSWQKIQEVNYNLSIYGYQVPLTTRDELGELAQSFNEMSNQLAREDEVRRRFVADAAHELRSLVASLKRLLHQTEEYPLRVLPIYIQLYSTFER